MTEAETYLASIAAQVRGAGARRLSAELQDHLEDAIAHHVASGFDPADAECLALERLGPADELLAVWKSQARARRAQDRRRATLVAFAAVTASALALVQHASGRQANDRDSPAVVRPACATSGTAPSSAFSLAKVGRTALAAVPRAAHDPAGSRRSGANPFRCKRR